ncbi:MAG: c-type cytochrome [Armatimonadetes bacterium]|nr:c-type cytochrome [Armatimonadota bacterium]
MRLARTLVWTLGLSVLAVVAGWGGSAPVHHSPTELALLPGGTRLAVVEGPARQVSLFDPDSPAPRAAIAMPAEPSGIAISADGRTAYVTLEEPQGRVAVVDLEKRKITAGIRVGHSPFGPLLAPDGKTLYVCNRFDNAVGFVDLAARKQIATVPVLREPCNLALTPDGKLLLAANLLPVGPADVDVVAASVSLIDTATRAVCGQIELPNGSTDLRGMAMSPDGKYCYLAHILARFHLPTTQLERGWQNTNALTVIDIAKRARLNTVLLDDVDLGAANPWGVALSTDQKLLVVAHAGTHEISVIDAPALLAKLEALPIAAGERDPRKSAEGYDQGALTPDDVPNDLSFLVGLRRRIDVPGKGPRSIVLAGHRAIIGEYFSDDLATIDLDAAGPPRFTLAKTPGSPAKPTQERDGERIWHDATICFQHWQSCSSCHPDGRVDGLNWDLMNDGIGNPKNNRSMLYAHRTPPSMSTGVREDAKAAVRAGIRFILFAVRPEEEAAAIDSYLMSLRPVPSPLLVDGKLSASAQRGRKLYENPAVGCAKCHGAPAYTDLKSYDVGTEDPRDHRTEYDTPTLAEVWRTAPYLHDGRAATILDVLTGCNETDRHGKTQRLTKAQLADLAAYVLSL